VADLEKAIYHFEMAGFSVSPGGEHTHTHNALIIFNDQSYIELLSLKPSWYRWFLRTAAKIGLLHFLANRKSDISWRLLRWIGYEYGPIDWALRTDNIDLTVARLKENDAVLLDASDYQRTTADGKIAKWTMASAKDLDLPFLIEDQTNINLRVPHDSHTQHANGALGIKKIVVSTGHATLANNKLTSLLHLSDSNAKVENVEITPDLKLQHQLKLKVKDTTIEYKALDRSAGKFTLELRYQGGEPKQLNCEYPKGTKIWLIPTDGQ
jgi:hypothetical protein